jgi:lipoprotein-releasing system permease protein
MLERLKKDEVLLPREFTVIGTFRTGSPQVDGNMMISTLRVMQELYGLEDGAHGISVKLRPGVDALSYSQELENGVLRPGLEAISWLESNRDFLFVVQQEKRVISFIIIFIILVASFSITIALMMAVMRKTREIGLLVAMGGKPSEVACSFCFQGFVIGTIGTGCGIVMALVCLHFRSQILTAYAWVTNSAVEFLGVYDVYEIPVHYMASDFITVIVFAVIVSTLAGLIPALRAARLKPADALRSE